MAVLSAERAIRSRWLPTVAAVAATLLAATAFVCLPVRAQSETPTEYEIKAGFLYKFLLFVEWPDKAFEDSKNEIVIAILGEDPFGEAFDPVEGQEVDGRKLVIKRLGDAVPSEPLPKCHLLFVSGDYGDDVEGVLEGASDQPVLTVGEKEGFVQAGGMVNFVEKDKKLRFEVNADAVERAGLRLRSKLLRLAILVKEDEDKGVSRQEPR